MKDFVSEFHFSKFPALVLVQQKYQRAMQNIAECKQGKVTIGSICAGMATAEIVLAQLQECFPRVEALAQKQFC